MSGQTPLEENLKTTIATARLLILENCADLIDEGVYTFRAEYFARACFLAMSAIEEAGKLAVLRFFAHKEAEKLGFEPQGQDAKGLAKFLRDHPEKAREAAGASLMINSGADRRQGRHPVSGIHRTSGIVLLVRSGRWMAVRNSCLYVDLQLTTPQTESPRRAVSKALAFYMICMAHELVAEQGTSAIQDSSGWLEFEKRQIASLLEFREQWGASCDVDSLDFLRDPRDSPA